MDRALTSVSTGFLDWKIGISGVHVVMPTSGGEVDAAAPRWASHTPLGPDPAYCGYGKCRTFLCATRFTFYMEFILDLDVSPRWPCFEHTEMSELPLKSLRLCLGQLFPVPWASVSLDWCKETPWAISICCPLGSACSVIAADRTHGLLVLPSQGDGRDLGS